MRTDVKDLLDGLKFSYLQYKASKSSGSTVNIAYTQGYCIALEDILEVHFGVTTNKIREIKKDILGNISLDRIHTQSPVDFIEIVEI